MINELQHFNISNNCFLTFEVEFGGEAFDKCTAGCELGAKMNY